MHRWLALAIGLGGCGRFSFDGNSDAAAVIDAPPIDALPLCFADDFNDGNANGWALFSGTWDVQASAGPDNTTAFGPGPGSSSIVTHPALASVMAGHVAVDFYLIDLNADFNVLFVQPGWTDPEMSNRYDVLVVPVNGDTPQDAISTINASDARVVLAGHAWTINELAWHNLDVDRRLDGSISVLLDGAPYMQSPADATFAGPFDIIFRFYDQGVIDNIHVDCTR